MSHINYEALAEVVTHAPHVAGMAVTYASPPVLDIVAENIKSVGQSIVASESPVDAVENTAPELQDETAVAPRGDSIRRALQGTGATILLGTIAFPTIYTAIAADKAYSYHKEVVAETVMADTLRFLGVPIRAEIYDRTADQAASYRTLNLQRTAKGAGVLIFQAAGGAFLFRRATRSYDN